MFAGSDTIALDIGSKYIKVVRGKKKKKGVSIVNCNMCEAPEDGPQYNENVISAISRLIDKKNLKYTKAAIGIKGQDIIMRHMEMPAMKNNELRRAAELEILQYLPIDSSEYIIDLKIMQNEKSKDKNVVNVLLVAVPKQKIQRYVDIAKGVGLDLKCIDMSVNSVTRLFEHSKGAEKCIGLIDIGYKSSTISLLENSELFIEKEIEVGSEQMDEIINQAFDFSDEDVDNMKQNKIWFKSTGKVYSNHDSQIYEANRDTYNLFDILINNIYKINDFYTSTGINKRIEYLYLYGGGAHIKGLAGYITSTTGIETRLYDIDSMPKLVNVSDELKENIHLYLNCISLLLRED